MPIYEYECLTCSVRFERKQSVNDEAIKTCPDCGGKVRKIFYAAPIIFKGSGFYKTDNASGSSGSAGSSGSSGNGNGSAAKKDEPAKSETPKSEPAAAASAKSEPAKSEAKKAD